MSFKRLGLLRTTIGWPVGRLLRGVLVSSSSRGNKLAPDFEYTSCHTHTHTHTSSQLPQFEFKFMASPCHQLAPGTARSHSANTPPSNVSFLTLTNHFIATAISTKSRTRIFGNEQSRISQNGRSVSAQTLCCTSFKILRRHLVI